MSLKPILFLLNNRSAIKPDRTTSTLMLACHRQGHPVLVTDVVHLQASDSTTLAAEAIELPTDARIDNDLDAGRDHAGGAGKTGRPAAMQAIFVRTTPGKDIERAWAHRLALEVLRLAHECGVRILNNPIGLQRASSKLYTVCLPQEFVPRTKVCHSLVSVQEFAEQLDCPFVLKPLLGSQGRDVFFLDTPDAVNTRQVVDILGRTGYLVVQEFIPEAAAGDIRVLTLDDSIITGGGVALGIRRIPAAGELRSNISLGGTAEVIELSSRQIEICTEVAGYLYNDGIRFAGLDMIGEKMVEVNVYSPSGLQELDRFLGRDISGEVAARLVGG